MVATEHSLLRDEPAGGERLAIQGAYRGMPIPHSDVEGRPISTSTTNDGALVQGWGYGYNAMGMITSITDAAETRVFEYDAVYRLTGETRTSAAGVESIRWTYDAAGNRLSRTSNDATVSYTYNADNEMTGTTSADTLTATGSVEPGTGNSDRYESYAAIGNDNDDGHNQQLHLETCRWEDVHSIQ